MGSTAQPRNTFQQTVLSEGLDPFQGSASNRRLIGDRASEGISLSSSQNSLGNCSPHCQVRDTIASGQVFCPHHVRYMVLRMEVDAGFA